MGEAHCNFEEELNSGPPPEQVWIPPPPTHPPPWAAPTCAPASIAPQLKAPEAHTSTGEKRSTRSRMRRQETVARRRSAYGRLAGHLKHLKAWLLPEEGSPTIVVLLGFGLTAGL